MNILVIAFLCSNWSAFYAELSLAMDNIANFTQYHEIDRYLILTMQGHEDFEIALVMIDEV